jgi:Holliday junction DNA helicase RuvA
VREDVQQLYGFLTETERDLFEQLLNISGIGPKSAIAIIGHTDITAFQQAVATSNIRLLSSIPGIGKKTAERLIIEMRDRLPKLSSGTGGGSLMIDASQALMNLGYTPVAAQQAIQKTIKAHPEERDLGRLITLSLQNTK